MAGNTVNPFSRQANLFVKIADPTAQMLLGKEVDRVISKVPVVGRLDRSGRSRNGVHQRQHHPGFTRRGDSGMAAQHRLQQR